MFIVLAMSENLPAPRNWEELAIYMMGGAVAFARFEIAVLISLVTFLTLRLMAPIKEEINDEDPDGGTRGT